MNWLARRYGGRHLALLPSFAKAPYLSQRPTKLSMIENVAVIPVAGILEHNTASDAPQGYMSYAEINTAFVTAVLDESVSGIALLIDSPGGTVAGCFDLANTIYAARGSKPINAILAEDAYSAAYALASACDRITIPQTGGAGSIGVLALHFDVSGALNQAGIKPTVIRSAPHKAEEIEFEPLTAGAQRRLQDQVDLLATLFISTVSRNRRLSEKAIRALNGEQLMGALAVAAGLADEVCTPDAALLEFANQCSTARGFIQ